MAGLYKFEVSWADKITEMSGGRVTFVHYAPGALVPMDEAWKALHAGVMDVMHYGLERDYVPLTYVMRLPFIGYPSMRGATEIFRKLYNEFPEMQEEFKTVHLFQIRAMPADHLHMATDKIIRVPADMKGVKIQAGEHVAPVVEAAGGAATRIELTDWYMSLETGLVDGIIDHFAVVHVFGLTPLFKNHTLFGTGGISQGMCGIMFNQKSWEKIPPDVQDMISSTYDWYTDGVLEMDQGEIARPINTGKEMGQKFIELTPEEYEQWRVLAEPVHEEWLSDMDAKGKPARAIYEEAKRLVAEYK
jgi:TRAP-type C4-dicarboxylate transport system substrate-binding protein